MDKFFFNRSFFGIKVPDTNKLLLSGINVGSIGTTTGNVQQYPTATEILDTIQKLKKDLIGYEPPLIRVWVGNDSTWNKALTDYPLIREDPFLCKPDDYFILAGIGVICGSNAYKRIWDIGFLAIWVEDPPD